MKRNSIPSKLLEGWWPIGREDSSEVWKPLEMRKQRNRGDGSGERGECGYKWCRRIGGGERERGERIGKRQVVWSPG